VESRTLPTATSSRGFGRRLLHSPLLEALAYPHGVDRYVELVRPLLLKRDVRAEVTAVRHQTPRSVTLTLRPNENWRGLRAGQFVGVSVEIDGVRETRPYSPAGSEHAAGGALELTVSTHPEGLVSRYLRNRARPGLIVGLTPAEGDFVLGDPRPARVLLVSGGSGITPVMAMLRTLCDEGFAGEIGFLNYARSSELALYGAELDRLSERHRGLRVARGFTRGGGLPLTGRFRREHLRAVLAEHSSAATFVCGPPALIDSVRDVWAQDGLAEPLVETFAAPALRFDTAGAEGLVRFAASGRQAANSGLPLLEQAEDAGLTPDHGCRMGICNTCSCVKTAGTVRNVITGEFSGAGEEQIRICVSVPVGDVALEL
jgi:ferredoxin-NADP reductase